MDHRSGLYPNFSDGIISGEYIMSTNHTSLSHDSQTQENQCADNIKEMTVKEYCFSQLREEKAREDCSSQVREEKEAPQMTLEEYILGKSILQCQDNSPEPNAQLTSSYLTGKMTRKWISNISKIQMGSGALKSDTHSPAHLILDVCERYIAKNILQESHLNDSVTNSQSTRWNVKSRTTKKMFPDIRSTIRFNPLDETSSAVQGIIDEDALEDSNHYGSNSSYVDQKVSVSLSEVPNHYAQDSMEFNTADQYSWTSQSINNRSAEYGFLGMSPEIETTYLPPGASEENIIPMEIEEAQCITEETNLEFEKRKKREAQEQARERKNERARERYKHWPQEKKDRLNKRRAERDKARRRIKNGMNQFEIQFAQRFLQGPDPNSSKGNLPETDKAPLASISFQADQSVAEYILQDRMTQCQSNPIDEQALKLGTEGQESIGSNSSYVDQKVSVSPSTNDQFIYQRPSEAPNHCAQEAMEFDTDHQYWTPQSINNRSGGLGMSSRTTEATSLSAMTSVVTDPTEPSVNLQEIMQQCQSNPIDEQALKLGTQGQDSIGLNSSFVDQKVSVFPSANDQFIYQSLKPSDVPNQYAQESMEFNTDDQYSWTSQSINNRSEGLGMSSRTTEATSLSAMTSVVTDPTEPSVNLQEIMQQCQSNPIDEQALKLGTEGQNSIGLTSSYVDQKVPVSPSTNDQFIYKSLKPSDVPNHYAQETMEFDTGDQYSWTPQSINNRSSEYDHQGPQTETTSASTMTPLSKNSPTTEVASDLTDRLATTTTTENEVSKVVEKVMATKRNPRPMPVEERRRRNWENKKRKFNSMSIEEQNKIRQRDRESKKRKRDRENQILSIPIQEATDEDIEEAHNIQMRRAKQEELRIARRAKANLRLEQLREKEGEDTESQDSIGFNSSFVDQKVSVSPSEVPNYYAQESMEFNTDDQYSWTPQSINNRSVGLGMSSQTEETVSSAMTPLYRNSPTTEVASDLTDPLATTTTTENEVKKVADKELATKRKAKVPMTAQERSRRNWENKKRKFNSMSIEEQQKIRQRNRESAKRIREKKLKSMSEEDKRLAREKKNERDRKWRQNMSKEEKDRQRQKRLAQDRANRQRKKEMENLPRVLSGHTFANNNKMLLYYLDAAPIL